MLSGLMRATTRLDKQTRKHLVADLFYINIRRNVPGSRGCGYIVLGRSFSRRFPPIERNNFGEAAFPISCLRASWQLRTIIAKFVLFASARLLKSWLSSSASSQPLAAQYKAVIIPSAASASKPSLLVKHAAFANKHLFNFCFLSNIRSILTSEKEELINVIENPPTWVRQLPPNSASAKALKLPVHREKLREQDLTSSSNILLFADEGRGISRIQSTLHTVRSKLLNPSTALALALDRFKEVGAGKKAKRFSGLCGRFV